MRLTQLISYQLLVILALSVACRPPATPKSGLRDISADGVWTRVHNDLVVFDPSIIGVKPNSFAAYKVDLSALNSILVRSPREYSAVGEAPPVILTLPTPDGSFSRFRVEESPIMEPGLADRFPQLKSYKAKGIDEPTATARFEKTPSGLHVMVLSAAGAFLVDTVGDKSASLAVSYFKTNLPADPDQVVCTGKGAPGTHYSDSKQSQTKSFHQHGSAGDNRLRVYRIAVGASHRYVAAIHDLNGPTTGGGDLIEEALTAIHRTIDRVDLIFETEVGVRFVLIDDEPKIIYTSPSNPPDPYDDDMDPDKLLIKHKNNLDDVIGTEHYDIGHLFIVSRGGQAAEPSACSVYKAEGLSGHEHPAGNVFDVQYVAHEIGHQMGASHSFNGTTRGCKYRNSKTAYEPGSGSTIMGYSSAPGVCDNETVQSTADPYFHAISLSEIKDFISSDKPGEGNTCPRKIETGNNFSPTVDGGSGFVIPGQTPFALTVQGSNDGDGDALTFVWEEFDHGPPDPPHPELPFDHLKKRPIFRSWPWSTNLVRIFPAMRFILAPPAAGIYVAETKPANNRTMTFRVTARDGRGRYGFDDVQIRVVSKRGPANVGPFAVTQPEAPVAWPQGSTQTVSWSVARTNLDPIKCLLVRISLVIRGDEDHPILLADNVPNEGSASITLPNDLPLTTRARVKIEAMNNIFFDVSKADIQIVGH